MVPAVRASRRTALAVLGGWVVGPWTPLQAQSLPSEAESVTEARAILARAQQAAATLNFTGTLVSGSEGRLSSSRVAHYAVGDQVYEWMEALDGRQQRLLRHNDQLLTLWPQGKVAVLEKREWRGGWSTTPQRVDAQASDVYELRADGELRLAGRESKVWQLEPRDTLRYPWRVWTDAATGLLLRAEVLSAGPRSARTVLESSTFSDIALGVRPQPDQVLQPWRAALRGDGWRVQRPLQQRVTLETAGWSLGAPVPGFTLLGALRRGLEGGSDEEPLLQAVFGDGLTQVSLFVEAHRPGLQRSDLQGQRGATATWTQRRGDTWFTAVGDVPMTTLRLFHSALERRPS